MRPTAVGICGSDLHWWAEGGIGDAVIGSPLVVGHEAAGVVVGGSRDGELVALDPAVACGTCRQCGAGHGNLCPSVRFLGHDREDGALRTLLVWPGALCHSLPPTIDDEAAAMLEPLGVAIHATGLAPVGSAATVAVVGCGPIGLLLVQLAFLRGASTVVASDPVAHRRDAAASYGADPFDPSSDNRRDLDGMADVTFEVSGTDDGLAQATIAARPGTRVAMVGIPDGDLTSFAASTPRRKGLTVLFVRRMHGTYPTAIDLVSGGRIDVASIVTHRFGLDHVAEAFDVAAARSGGKVVVSPTAPARSSG